MYNVFIISNVAFVREEIVLQFVKFVKIEKFYGKLVNIKITIKEKYTAYFSKNNIRDVTP